VRIGIDSPLLARDGGGRTMFTIAVGACLMHAAIDTGLADWTGLCGVFEGERSIEGILLVPSHDSGAWVSGHQMNVVVERRNRIACDQQAFLLQGSGRLLHVDTLFDGTACHFMSVL
jgi:hypothetical protein